MCLHKTYLISINLALDILYTNNIILNKFNTITVRGQWQWDDIVILAPIYFIRRQAVSKHFHFDSILTLISPAVRYISWCNLIVDAQSNKRWPYWHFYMLGRFIFDITHHYTHRRCCLFSNNWQMYDQINLSFNPSKCDLFAVSVFQIAWMKKIIYKYFTIYIFSFKSSIGVFGYIIICYWLVSSPFTLYFRLYPKWHGPCRVHCTSTGLVKYHFTA